MLETATMLVCLIVVDDLGTDLRNASPTPNLDALAAQGVNFPNVWSAPSCSPYRAQLMTGCYPHRGESRVGQVIQPKHGDSWRLQPSSSLLPARVNGQASMYGKWHLADLTSAPDHPFDCGWDEWWGTNYNLGGDGTYYGGFCYDNGNPDVWSGYITEVTANHAEYAILAQAEFVYVPLHGVHKPLEAPPANRHSFGDLTGASDEVLTMAMTEATDSIIGEIAQSALAEGYVVIVTTDNGTSGIIGGAKGSFEERGLNTWLHVVGPGIEPRIDDTLVCPPDLYSTVLHLVNGVDPCAQDGHSLYGNLFPASGVASSPREYAFSEKFKPNGPGPVDEFSSAIRDARWKLIYDEDDQAEFYDIENDPRELDNLLTGGLLDEEWQALRRLDEEHGRIAQ